MISVGLRFLPAGEERLRRARDRGLDGDDPSLPIRELVVDHAGRSLTVWVGPVEPGGEERELWELDVET